MDLEKVLTNLAPTEPAVRAFEGTGENLTAGIGAAHELMTSMAKLRNTALQELETTKASITRELSDLRQSIAVVGLEVAQPDPGLGFREKMRNRSQLRTLINKEKKLEAKQKQVETLMNAAASVPLAKVADWAKQVEKVAIKPNLHLVRGTQVDELTRSNAAIKGNIEGLKSRLRNAESIIKHPAPNLSKQRKKEVRQEAATLKKGIAILEKELKQGEALLAAPLEKADTAALYKQKVKQEKIRKGIIGEPPELTDLQQKLQNVTTRRLADLGNLLAATKDVAQLASNHPNDAAKKSMLSIANRAEKLKVELDKAQMNAWASQKSMSPKLAESFTTRTLKIEQELIAQQQIEPAMKEFRNWVAAQQKTIPEYVETIVTRKSGDREKTSIRNEEFAKLNRELSKANKAVVQIYDKIKNHPTPEGVAKLQEAIDAAKKTILKISDIRTY